MNDCGHIKIARKAFKSVPQGGNKFWNEPREFSRWEAWMYLIQAAAWKPHYVMAGQEKILIERGETPPLSIRFLQEAWRWNSTKRVHSFLQTLKDDGMIEERTRARIGNSRGNSSGNTYLIVKYEVYQGDGNTRETPSETPGKHLGNKTEEREAIENYNGTFNGEVADRVGEVEAGDNDPHGNPGAGRSVISLSAVGAGARTTGAPETNGNGRAPKARKPRGNTYSDDFLAAWASLPKRSGSDSKSAASVAFEARRKEGVSAEDMIAGARRYADYADAMIDDARYIMQGQRFFGPKREWENLWELPPKKRR